MGWIEDVLDATAEVETPKSFVKWASIAAISAVLRDRVYLDKFYYKLYPNLYILLVAKSGLRKGFAANLAQLLVTIVDETRVISGRNSIQAIVQALSQAIQRPKRPPMTKAHGFIVAGELSTTFVEDPHTLTILMDLHDGHYYRDKLAWKNTLKSSGVEELKDICVTMLGMINQTHLDSMLTKKDITGGFLARNIIKVESKRGLKNPLTRPPKVKFEVEKLVPYLASLAKVEGAFQYSSEGMDLFETWYDKFDPETINDDTGTANRVHDQVLKLAMCLSLSRNPKLILEVEDIQGALDLLDESVKTARQLTRGTGGKSEFAPKIKVVLEKIIGANGHRVIRSELLRNNWGDFNAMELDVIINTLHQAKSIIIIKRGGRDEEYQATKQLIEAYEAFKGGIH